MTKAADLDFEERELPEPPLAAGASVLGTTILASADLAATSRETQELPPVIEDLAVLAAIASLLGDAGTSSDQRAA